MAALARAESAERRAAELQAIFDAKTARPRRDLPIPERFRVRRAFGLTEVTWPERFEWWTLFWILLLALFIPITAGQNNGGGVVFCVLALLYAIPRLIVSIVNRSTLRVTGPELEFRRGPLGDKRIVIKAPAITQAYCRGKDSEWSVEVAHGGTYVEIARDLRQNEARFLEHTIEKQLGIVDRPHERESIIEESA